MSLIHQHLLKMPLKFVLKKVAPKEREYIRFMAAELLPPVFLNLNDAVSS